MLERGGVIDPTATYFSPRQDRLLRAAVRVVARSGLRGLTHRAVDAEADLPQGSCSAYMRTRVALLTRLTAYVTAQFADDIADLTRRIEGHSHTDTDGFVLTETLEMLRSWLQDPDLLLARIELTLEGTRQPEVAEILQGQWTQLVGIVEHAMASTGKPHSPMAARTLIAAVDGVLLRAVREESDSRASFLRDSLELLMSALVGKSTQSTSGNLS